MKEVLEGLSRGASRWRPDPVDARAGVPPQRAGDSGSARCLDRPCVL